MAFKQRQTLPNFRRLRSSEEFRHVLAAYFCSSKWFVIYANANKTGTSRLGIITSKRLMPRSTSRNYVKRLVREMFRQNFPADRALDIVVRLRRPLDRESSQDGRQTLVQLLGDVQKNASVID